MRWLPRGAAAVTAPARRTRRILPRHGGSARRSRPTCRLGTVRGRWNPDRRLPRGHRSCRAPARSPRRLRTHKRVAPRHPGPPTSGWPKWLSRETGRPPFRCEYLYFGTYSCRCTRRHGYRIAGRTTSWPHQFEQVIRKACPYCLTGHGRWVRRRQGRAPGTRRVTPRASRRRRFTSSWAARTGSGRRQRGASRSTRRGAVCSETR